MKQKLKINWKNPKQELPRPGEIILYSRSNTFSSILRAQVVPAKEDHEQIFYVTTGFVLDSVYAWCYASEIDLPEWVEK